MMNRILLAAAAAACLPFAAQAHDEAAHPVEANKLIVVRDADTGALRAATADEAAALASKPAAGKTAMVGARAVAAQQPLLKGHRSGAQGARITDEMASYSVAVRRADGTLDTQCIEGKADAEAALSPAQQLVQPARTDK
jgi:hypothetical protein